MRKTRTGKRENETKTQQVGTKPKTFRTNKDVKAKWQLSRICRRRQSLIPEEPPRETTQRLKRYSILTKTRKLEINWDKVLLLTRKKATQIAETPPPYNQIQMRATGVILGKKINMHGKQNHTIQHRLAKAKQIWGVTRRKLFQNSYIPEKLRIQLWNALIRSTLTYALQTQELSESQEKINSFSQKRMRK